MPKSISQPIVPCVLLPFGWFKNADAVALKGVMLRLSQTVELAPTGLVVGPPAHSSTFKVHRLCDARDMPDFDNRWDAIFGARPRIFVKGMDVEELRKAAEQHVKERNFDWFAWFMMKLSIDEQKSIDAALAIYRDALLPAFFGRYPGGRVLAVTYERNPAVDGYLSVINILNRARRVGFDLDKLLASSGKDSMAWVGLHHPQYFAWHSLFLAFAAFFPKLHGFVASLHHQAYLVYLLPKAEEGDDVDPGWFERTMPGLTMAKCEGIKTPSGDIRFRKSPLGRTESYKTDDLEAYVRTVTANAEGMLHRFCDLTQYPDDLESDLDAQGQSVGLVDLDFARNTLLTLFVLLRRTVTNTFESDTFERVMTLYDIVDLHSALISTNQSKAAEAFKHLIHRQYALDKLTKRLKSYPRAAGY